MSFLDRNITTTTRELIRSFERVGNRNSFGCLLCGNLFQVGDKFRWIFSPKGTTGNFYVCEKCNGPDEEMIDKAIILLKNANVVLARRV